MSFEKALEENPTPSRIGDVRLRFDSPLLLAEADRPCARLRGPLLLAAAAAFALFAAAALLYPEPPDPFTAVALGLAAAALVAAGAAEEDRARRRRRFALDFDAHTLRLDFTARPAGLGRSLVVPFERVEALHVLEQPDGAWALTVDVLPHEGAPPLREVLVASVGPAEAQALGSLHRMLDGAFDL